MAYSILSQSQPTFNNKLRAVGDTLATAFSSSPTAHSECYDGKKNRDCFAKRIWSSLSVANGYKVWCVSGTLIGQQIKPIGMIKDADRMRIYVYIRRLSGGVLNIWTHEYTRTRTHTSIYTISLGVMHKQIKLQLGAIDVEVAYFRQLHCGPGCFP